MVKFEISYLVQDFFFFLKDVFLCHFQDQLRDLQLVIEDTVENVATLLDCSFQQSESLQLLGEVQNISRAKKNI